MAELEREQLSAADKAIADARDQASAEATATTEARVRAEMAGQPWRPQSPVRVYRRRSRRRCWR